jgi:hypothetical protein
MPRRLKGNLKGKDCLGYLHSEGKIILKQVLGKDNIKMYLKEIGFDNVD